MSQATPDTDKDDQKKRSGYAKTMRIKIRPDTVAGQQSKAQGRIGVRAPSATPVLVKRVARPHRSLDYAKLLQSVYDGVLITNERGRIIDFNSRTLDLLQAEASQLAGNDIISIISGASASLLTAIRHNLEQHRYTLIEAQFIRTDRSTFPAEIAVNKIDLDEDGQLCFLVRDVTVRKKAETDLEQAVARLKAHDRARSQFVSNVSHELRTPLTSMIYAVANMLRGVVGEISPRARRYLEMLDGDSRRLLRTVNDILDLRKVETSTLALDRSRFPVDRLVAASVESLHVQAEQKSVTLLVETCGEHRFLHADPEKLERVILNVVGNALKFTPEGGKISVQISSAENAPDHVTITVEDTGVGIPDDAIDKVTLRYFTVGEQPIGSGLGLAISKEIVELHDGHITVESPPSGRSRGTLVRITLPTVTPPRILIAEGDAEVHNQLEKQLKQNGYLVARADGNRKLISRLQEEPFDMVVLHLVPGDRGSTEAILAMKGDHRLKRMPIVVVADKDLDDVKNEVIGTFQIPVVNQPWDPEALLDTVSLQLMKTSA